jgi:hypothetical protein
VDVTTTRDAKEFLVGKIAEQAQRSGIALSGVERKMLYYSESDCTPETAEANAAFEREYDQAQYERKISRIVRQLLAKERHENAGDFDLWKAAVERLREGDHYLLVMVEQAGGAGRPRGDLVRLLASALLICAAVMALVVFLANR